VILYHETDEEGVKGIRAHGFGVSHTGDSPGHSWFYESAARCIRTASRRGWLVVVDVPDDVVEPYGCTFEDGSPYLGNVSIPREVANDFRSAFRFRPLGDNDL